MKILYDINTDKLVAYNRADDELAVGLADNYIIYDVIHNIEPAYNTSTQYIRFTEVIDHDNKTVIRGWEIRDKAPDPVPQPIAVSMRSFRLALGLELFNQLSAAINSIADAEQKYQALTYIEYSLVVVRDHPVVIQFSAALNKTEEEVDAVFEAARQLDFPTAV